MERLARERAERDRDDPDSGRDLHSQIQRDRRTGHSPAPFASLPTVEATFPPETTVAVTEATPLTPEQMAELERV